MSAALTRSAVLAAAALALTGCLEQLVIDKEVSLLRRGAPATNTLHDYETAKTTSQAELGRLEGLHRLAPTNEDVLFLLTRGWTLWALRYGIDDYERAVRAGDAAMAQYHLDRMVADFRRAQHYGLLLLDERHGGMNEAREAPTELVGWTNARPNEPKDAEPLLWTGLAFLGRAVAVEASGGEPAADDRRIGLSMVDRSVALDETAVFGLGHIALGILDPRPDGDGAAHLHRAVALSEGRYLPARLALAWDDCRHGLRDNARLRFRAIAHAGDVLPAARLDNVIAMQRAARYFDSPEVSECGVRPAKTASEPGQGSSETRTSTKRPPGN